MEQIEVLLTPQEVADIIKLDVRTLKNWRCLGTQNLPYKKIGNRVRYDPADVREWLASKQGG